MQKYRSTKQAGYVAKFMPLVCVTLRFYHTRQQARALVHAALANLPDYTSVANFRLTASRARIKRLAQSQLLCEKLDLACDYDIDYSMEVRARGDSEACCYAVDGTVVRATWSENRYAYS